MNSEGINGKDTIKQSDLELNMKNMLLTTYKKNKSSLKSSSDFCSK